MKTVGLITEYNPFHNGHQYHIEEAKRITGADRVIVIMSGDYVQRGQSAIMPKHLRAKMALTCGASAVFELPVCYATGSAELFALGGVSMLNSFHCIDALCFGSECGNISSLKSIAHILLEEPEEYKQSLKEELRNGASFPKARSIAMSNYTKNDEIVRILEQPNNILGIEYLKALEKLSSTMTPYTIQRVGSSYHDAKISDTFSSASAIREQFQRHTDSIDNYTMDPILKYQIPPSCFQMMKQEYKKSFPVYMHTFSLVLKYKLLSENTFTIYQDVSEELSNRIKKKRNEFQNFEQFCELLKTREMTHSRISRALLHIMLHITKCDTGHYLDDHIVYYARLLGFCTKQSDILSKIKESSTIPILSKIANTSDLNDEGICMLNSDCFASDLYQSVISDLYHTDFVNEYQKEVIRI